MGSFSHISCLMLGRRMADRRPYAEPQYEYFPGGNRFRRSAASCRISFRWRDRGGESPNQKYLYIAFTNGTVYGYAIDGTTGALTQVPRSPYNAIGGNSIASTPAGTFLFVSDSVTGNISAFSISATDGSLTAVGSPFPSGIAARQMTTDGQGKYLYATSGSGSALVAAMAIGATGTLSTIPGTPSISPCRRFWESTRAITCWESPAERGFDDHIHVFNVFRLQPARLRKQPARVRPSLPPLLRRTLWCIRTGGLRILV